MKESSFVHLRVCSLNGRKIYSLEMASTEQIEQIYIYIDKARGIQSSGESTIRDYVLVNMSGFDAKLRSTNEASDSQGVLCQRWMLTDLSQTLADADLSGHILLRMAPLKKPTMTKH
ncbi:unnamed protein product [Protopolystoma xenopodis]|uniref:Uncharacterized protein n=1 Tax=Protopolystoma xenopodis TaxID=117903 RepID=A0A448WYY7_9PLAT|nr:unnamed protein product [Protopolystoma xenopodis]